LLESLPEEDRRAVLASCVRRRYRRDEVVFHEGDPGDCLFLLDRGRAAVRVTSPVGDTVILALLGPGEMFGEQALLADDHMRFATVAALEHLEVRCLHRDRFAELRERHAAVDRLLIAALDARARRLTQELLEALYVPAETRVLRRLLSAARLYGTAPVPLTQEELANLAGTTRPTTNRALRKAEEAGVLRLGRGSVEILDRGRLDRLAR
jgi:CRP/FNR family transcriptional regulator, cyclic AMP receptor protein